MKETHDNSSYDIRKEKTNTTPGTSPSSMADIQDLTRKVGDWSVYGTLRHPCLHNYLLTHLAYYFKAVGSPILILFISLNFSSAACTVLTQPILSAWAEAGGNDIW